MQYQKYGNKREQHPRRAERRHERREECLNGGAMMLGGADWVRCTRVACHRGSDAVSLLHGLLHKNSAENSRTDDSGENGERDDLFQESVRHVQD